MLSDSFYDSKFCLCEMGASWVKTNKHFPVIIPPFRFEDIEGVIINTQGLVINNRGHINQMQEQICSLFGLERLSNNIWENRRDRFLNKINSLIEENENSPRKGKVDARLDLKSQVLTSGSIGTFASDSSLIPKLQKITDINKSQYLKSSYQDICYKLKDLFEKTKEINPEFEYSYEEITNRKAIFYAFLDGNKVAGVKIWIGSTMGFQDGISLSYGPRIGENNDLYQINI